MLERPRIIDVERKPRKCPKYGERVVDIIYGTGDMTEIEFVMEYRREGIMGGDSIPRRPPIWACSCGCKRFRKVNLDGTDVPVKVKMLNRRTKQEQSQVRLNYALQEGGRPKVNNEIIETERLLLRRWKLSDADALCKYACDPEVGPHAGWPPHKSVEESKMIIREVFTNDFTWAVVLKKTNEPIGCMGYYPFGKSNIEIGKNDAEVGYWMVKPHWNKGYCTEA